MAFTKCDWCTSVAGVLFVCVLCYFEPQAAPHTAKEMVTQVASLHYSIFAGQGVPKLGPLSLNDKQGEQDPASQVVTSQPTYMYPGSSGAAGGNGAADAGGSAGQQITASVLYDYVGEEGFLSLEVGQTIVVLDQSDTDWWAGHVAGQPVGEGLAGLFPSSYVEVTETAGVMPQETETPQETAEPVDNVVAPAADNKAASAPPSFPGGYGAPAEVPPTEAAAGEVLDPYQAAASAAAVAESAAVEDPTSTDPATLVVPPEDQPLEVVPEEPVVSTVHHHGPHSKCRLPSKVMDPITSDCG